MVRDKASILLMKHFTLLFITHLLFSVSLLADFNIAASAVYLDINGTSSFYNTQKSSSLSGIGTNNLNAQLGVFGNNSGNLKLIGAEIRTIKNNTGSICGGNLYYSIYPEGDRPAAITFSSISLSVFCSCNGNSFSSCGGGSCGSIYEQKLQNVTRSIDLTTFEAGNYTLEIYYEASGENCSQQRFDNAGGANYKADFTISAPLAISLTAFGASCTDNAVKLKWVIQNDADIVKYEIEKSSTGLIFNPIGTVNANGIATMSSYSFLDTDPIVGTNYYRMRVYHKNTAVNLSSIMRIYFGKVGNTIFIYPNPSGSALAVRFAAVNRGHYQMSILTNSGQQISSTSIEHDGLDKTIKIDMPSSLPKGVYRLFLIDKTRFYKQAFLIK
ncbi:hypothetical protein LK994_06855 [Ferruginibacter lapsinanis]|uniref:T9SS type A sorting domain-containing protein n=1 Tax=Ferruginibacter lapsinanis TaxID=563172 RepID=UPI001E342BBF|nr:hypothetical protein [Ferruginibacter lapsinanis]UEG51192.1 hypothetical protein LK994_06855 [Ferruginibacter lapsinanis]